LLLLLLLLATTMTAFSDAMGELALRAHSAASIGTRKQDCLTAACAVLRSEQTLQHSAATLPLWPC
jgi:hypothetical protein